MRHGSHDSYISVIEQTSVIRDQVLLRTFNNGRCSLIESGKCFTISLSYLLQ